MSQSMGDAPAAPRIVPKAPPLPAPRPFQGVRHAALKIMGLPSRPPSPERSRTELKLPSTLASFSRFAALGVGQDATTSHRTGLEINTVAINVKGTHALLGGKEIFKTVKVENGLCVEDRNLRTVIRSTPTQASGEVRQVYSINIADVAWAKGDCGDYVAAATTSGKIILYDLGERDLHAALLYEHSRQVHKVTFNPHRGSLLLSGSQDGTVRLWDVKDPRSPTNELTSKRKFSGAADGVRDVKWSPTDGMDFAFTTDSGWIQRWDIRNLKVPKMRIPAHATTCTSIDWHPDGQHVVSAGLDRMMRIWDFAAPRTHKPIVEVKTPYPVSNARWRPACESSMPEDQGARMCMQIATAYDQDHPVVHVWDLRRPALPFRELFPHATAATDMLWHSQDLLWTVGGSKDKGAFVQTDIHHTTKNIARRNLQALAVSSVGEMSMAIQKRHPHRPRHASLPKLQTPTSSSLSQSPEFTLLSRSWADESLDHSFLTVQPRRASHSKSSTRYSSATATPPSGLQSKHVLNLGDVLAHRQSSVPGQPMFHGPNPLQLERSSFDLMATSYDVALHVQVNNEALPRLLHTVFEQCAAASADIGYKRLAQTWDIVAFSVTRHIDRRLAMLRGPTTQQKILPRPGDNVVRKAITALLEQDKSPNTSPGVSPASMRPLSSIAQALAGNDNSSNATTPLARPLPNGRQNSSMNVQAQLPDPYRDHDIDPLPPSLTSTAIIDGVQPEDSETRQLTHENLQAMQHQRSTPMPIEHSNPHARVTKVKSPGILHVEPDIKPPNRPSLLKNDSDESFSFLVGSNSSNEHSMTGSLEESNRPASMVHGHPTRPLLRVNSQSPVLLENGLESYESSSETSVSIPEPLPDHLDIDNASVEQTVSQSMELAKSAEQTAMVTSLEQSSLLDCEEGEPFRILEMLQELILYYTAKDVNAQTAAQLMLLLVPLLTTDAAPTPREIEKVLAIYSDAISLPGLSEGNPSMLEKIFGHMITAGINPLQLESIFSTYHEQLLAHGAFVAAASLRRLAFPAFPAIYDYGLGVDNLTLTCGTCRKRVSLLKGRTICGHCAAVQSDCAVCSCAASPFGKNDGSALVTACLVCNHSTHAECAREWFDVIRGRGCPTEGCLCLCVS